MSSEILQKLNKLYTDSEQIDKETWAEMRSNVLLISGNHYQKRNWKWMSHIRETANIADDQKIRLTKNHIQRIYKTYVNKIVSMAPASDIRPQNEKELKDTKSASLHSSVWNDIKIRHNFREKVQQYAGDYVGLGETWVKVYWDWTKGVMKGEEPILEEVPGEEPRETGKKNVFSGGLVFERIFAFNVFRPKTAQSLEDAPWVGIRKMASKSDLLAKYGEDEEKKKAVEPDGKTTFLVFEHNQSSYEERSDEVLVKEIIYRPSYEYPKGYFYMFTEKGLLEEGELPFGIWPLVSAGFDEVPTHPRFLSPIKQWKPYQVELNRVASKIAEHQITLGDDKLVMVNGGKLSSGGNMPGVRAYSVTGASPIVIPGRTGEQYLGYATSTIEELYQAAMVSEELTDKAPTQVDPYALLMQTSRWKAKFSLHTQRFERFVVELTKLALETTRKYIEDDELIKIIGKDESVNIVEFKNSNDIYYQIYIEPGAEDIETKIGRKLAMDRYVQYAGANMDIESLGKFIRLDPYLNKEQMFADFTMEYDNATNDILQLDRGQMPPQSKYRYKDPGYIVKRLSNRMGQGDFQSLPPQVQQMYAQTIQMYEQLIVQLAQDQAALEAQFIPTSGPLARADLWVPDPKDPAKQVRLSLPTSSLIWLKDALEKQGATTEVLAQQQQAVVADIAHQLKMNAGQAAAPSVPSDMPASGQQLLSMVQQQNGAGQPQ